MGHLEAYNLVDVYSQDAVSGSQITDMSQFCFAQIYFVGQLSNNLAVHLRLSSSLGLLLVNEFSSHTPWLTVVKAVLSSQFIASVLSI